jgi:lysophospholipid acyltransferase (LPLAT)-like uncharacterized protein
MALLPAGAYLTRLLGRTLRCTIINHDIEQTVSREGSTILAAWHGHLFYFAYHYRDQAIPVVVSRSTDGEIIARIMGSLGFLPVRGSSSKGGTAAFREVLGYIKEGRHMGITPDGPRGPRCKVQRGVIDLARSSGAPILPGSFAAWPRVVIGSWDRFVVPLPFSRMVVVFGETLRVGPDDDLEAACQTLEERLNDITRQAEAALGS